jgi:hypothetical protein
MNRAGNFHESSGQAKTTGYNGLRPKQEPDEGFHVKDHQRRGFNGQQREIIHN